jgi:altronate hydrolase
MSVAEKTATKQGLVVHPADTVGVATSMLGKGERPTVGLPRLVDSIPAGHKFALSDISAGQPVIKYGAVIGRARHDIPAGAHVHSHNLETMLGGEQTYSWSAHHPDQTGTTASPSDSFMGYRRFDGRVGIRNEIWVIAMVGCVNRTAERIARMAANQVRGQVDGVHAITHPFGCSQLGDDLDATRAILAGLAQNPNAGGVLLVGLGCESNQFRDLLDSMPDADPLRVRAFACQDIEDELDAGISAVVEIAHHMATTDQREACPVSDLVIGLKCGGSDAFSGLTANPVLGRVTDRLDGAGGSTILTEVPEMFGAEHILMDRAASREVHTEIGAMMNRFKGAVRQKRTSLG